MCVKYFTDIWNEILTWCHEPVPPYILTDKDGNSYTAVTIGTQIWLASNYRTTKYADGTAIPEIQAAGSSGITDWFLPSKDEFNQMYVNLHLFGVGNFVNMVVYSTSSEYDATNYWVQHTGVGAQFYVDKVSTPHVRACRSFTTTDIYSIRDTGPAGGLIFYIINNGGGSYTYSEAAPSDQSALYLWSNVTNQLIGTTGTAIGTGQANTTAIIGQAGHTTSAAKLCDDLSISGTTGWGADTTGARCYYDNDQATYDSVHGALYNWYALHNAHGFVYLEHNGVQEAGWKVPELADWDILMTKLGNGNHDYGTLVGGGKLKETGTTHWWTPNTGATDTYGFKALASGKRNENGTYYSLMSSNTIWVYDDTNNTYMMLSNAAYIAKSVNELYNYGYSVRLMKYI